MIPKEAKLNSKIFNKDVEMVPIRQGFGEGLVIAGEKDKNIVALCADLTESTRMILFKEKFPDRFIEIGVAEQNLASVGSGMAAMGKVPVISSYAMFSPGRNWEQIRTTICYNDRKVIIAGSHAGISVGPDGGTHQAIEDIAITRVIPNMTVISPCDSIEAKKAMIAIAESDIKTPAYLRLAREKTPVMTTAETPFEVGKAQVFYESKKPDVTIIATGALVFKALEAALELEEDGVGSIVINLATIKPLDEKTIIAAVKKSGAVVTVEEHQVAGGMGSAVAECLAKNFPVPIEFVGVQNLFGQSGTQEELLKHYKMDTIDIKKASEKVIGRK
ncbi:MAG: transketolase C-terminal domain-containing protein [Candidatus Paceibacterota bacterium]|jgi:transketolase